ncbi:MAG: ribosomal-processing cysteine protease Prp [Clostridiales bacterium]|nr:ribosomal-processing cysteine protease Prp [Clostridiales bacterium]
MTKFCFYKRDGVYFGFEETGHAGFGESGDDILCAAFSAMTMLIINAIEVSYASNVEYQIDEENASIRVMAYGALAEHEDDESKRFAVSGILQAYFLQLNDMLEEYYDYMDVTETEA